MLGMSVNELRPDDVVSLDKSKNPIAVSTFQVKELTSNLASRCGRELSPETIKQWSSCGVECQVLQTDGKGWKKGKVRLSLEFVPDEIDSPLNELREKLNIE